MWCGCVNELSDLDAAAAAWEWKATTAGLAEEAIIVRCGNASALRRIIV